ncbi:MAG TPA: hypothetical protein VHI71_00680 [Actinomycetota bacterium]|nr:hypothetical protein [Actinomycetota bacterium]
MPEDVHRPAAPAQTDALTVRGRATLVSIVLAAAALPAQPHATASPQPDPALWLIGADGSNAHEVDPNVERWSGYDWSPDGSFLAYGNGDVWVLEVATGEKVNLTSSPGVYEDQPSWSPDGARIAFTRAGDVWAMDADGSNAARVTEGAALDSTPDWSPVGDLISYLRFEGGEPRSLNVVDAGGGGPSVSLAQVTVDPFSTSWSPGGREIAYVSTSGELHVVDVGTGATTLLAANAESPSWAPAGDLIAYAWSADLYVVSRGDASSRLLLEHAAPRYSTVSWSPDGRAIAFGGYELGVVDVATGSSVVLTAGQPTEEEYTPLWSPTGDLIAYVGVVWCCNPHYWDRRIDAAAWRHLVLSGRVHSALPECSSGVRVKVQRRSSAGWRTVARGVTGADGSYSFTLRDRPGRYVVVTPRQGVVADDGDYTCLRSRSDVLRHRHRASPRT